MAMYDYVDLHDPVLFVVTCVKVPYKLFRIMETTGSILVKYQSLSLWLRFLVKSILEN